VILCGGRGTRLRERTREIPKPLIEIGGRPIVEHVIELYAAQGFRRFLLATGYRGELIERFAAARAWPTGVEVRCVDTGANTPTGGRVKLLAGALSARDWLGSTAASEGGGMAASEGGGMAASEGGGMAASEGGGMAASEGGESFCLTYADGLADIDLERLLRFHESHGALATITVVRPELQFGVAELDGEDGRVLGFREKPRSEHWINGGFLCLRAGALDYLREDSVLEREPLQQLAADEQLRAYRHEGFWECMDTYKDAVALNDLWASGVAPWRVLAGVRTPAQNPSL
jgi:glucose-1-phosphate cytidylyltransferase